MLCSVLWTAVCASRAHLCVCVSLGQGVACTQALPNTLRCTLPTICVRSARYKLPLSAFYFERRSFRRCPPGLTDEDSARLSQRDKCFMRKS
uniref:Putative secreted protein n=1 Tax=Anopheles marajoara TaxID=58244 RepID=A0A2M4C9P1_9DIPT